MKKCWKCCTPPYSSHNLHSHHDFYRQYLDAHQWFGPGGRVWANLRELDIFRLPIVSFPILGSQYRFKCSSLGIKNFAIKIWYDNISTFCPLIVAITKALFPIIITRIAEWSLDQLSRLLESLGSLKSPECVFIWLPGFPAMMETRLYG